VRGLRMGFGMLGLALALVLSVGGCQRGCLLSWLEQQGAAPDPRGIRVGGSLELQYVDCPDGLARCVDGVVESSRLFRHPDPCSGPVASCACPWDRVSPCSLGCVSEGAEVVLDPERAAHQLCVPAPDQLYARPAFGPAASDKGCGDERYHCVASVVIACDQSPVHAVAGCVRGCVAEGQTLDDDGVSDREAVALLCSR
jgi:hypothetical protein